jgi:hypothetical protein
MDLGFSPAELSGALHPSHPSHPSHILEEEARFAEPERIDEVTEASFHQTEIHSIAKESLDFLAGMAMPTIFKYFYPAVFITVWTWLCSFATKQRDFSQLALGLPRGFGKTTLIKLFVLWCILFTNKKFILIISSTATLAENFLSDVTDMLDEPNIKRVFGDWRMGLEKDTQAIKKFGFRSRNIILAGLGAGTSLRGLNLKNERPDVMVFEDIQTRECADSQVQSTALETWMIGTAMKAKSPMGCLFIFVANMYPTKHSLLRKLKHNSSWTKFIAGGILADGTSLWEDLQPIAQLEAEFKNDLEMGHPEIFYAEVLNDENASSNNLIDLSKLPPNPYSEGDICQGNFIMIDPSGQKTGSDNTAIGYFELYDSYPVLKSLVNKKLSPGDTIATALAMGLENNCRLIAIESVAYQSSLCYWFNFICQQRGIHGLEAVEVYPGGYSKNSRIMEMLKAYSAGEIFTDPSVKPIVHLQITQWNPLKKDNIDDVLDLMCYAPKIVEQFGEFVVAYNPIVMQNNSMIEVLPASATSCF